MSKEVITDNIVLNKPIVKPFYNYRNRPPKVIFCSKNPSKVFESPLDAKSPQELMDRHNMYVDRSSLKEPTPFFADLSQFSSFEDSLNHVRSLKEKFMALDVGIRAKFNHNPEEFCNYVSSKDFDIKEVLTAEQFKDYDRQIKEQEQQKQYQDYLNSDEYKKTVEENMLRAKYEKEQYENWKKNFKTT